MKNITFILVVISVALFSEKSIMAQKSDVSKELQVEGRLLSAEVEENQGGQLSFNLELVFSNKSTKPIILPKDVSELKVWEVYIANSKENLNNTKFLYALAVKESNLGEDKEFTKLMWKTKPPLANVIILQPKRAISYRVKVNASFENEQKYSTNKTWDRVKGVSPLWLKLGINLYFDSDVYRLLPNEKITFGAKLRKNWNKFGEFQFGRIYSEPISLDLSSAVVKTDSKP